MKDLQTALYALTMARQDCHTNQGRVQCAEAIEIVRGMMQAEPVAWQERASRNVNPQGVITSWSGWYDCRSPVHGYVKPDNPRMETTYEWRPLFAAPQAVPAGWLPIESAPKDGKRILLAIDHGQYGGKVWTGLWANRWFVSYGMASTEPTHWMPLLAAPKGGV
jgi:hypothetical protein